MCGLEGRGRSGIKQLYMYLAKTSCGVAMGGREGGKMEMEIDFFSFFSFFFILGKIFSIALANGFHSIYLMSLDN